MNITLDIAKILNRINFRVADFRCYEKVVVPKFHSPRSILQNEY